ncbi:MAG: YhbY family RNA-binding protein, partial [Candidatus Bathyarchaeia archaeon]
KARIWIGKSGATAQIMDEISRQLDQREIVKIKALKSALRGEEAKTMAEKIARGTDATLIDVRGHTFVLYKRRKGGRS